MASVICSAVYVAPPTEYVQTSLAFVHTRPEKMRHTSLVASILFVPSVIAPASPATERAILTVSLLTASHAFVTTGVPERSRSESVVPGP